MSRKKRKKKLKKKTPVANELCHYCLKEMVASYDDDNKKYFQDRLDKVPTSSTVKCKCTVPMKTVAGHCKCQCVCKGTTIVVTYYNSKFEPTSQTYQKEPKGRLYSVRRIKGDIK